jgi:hypothetical protein
MWPRGPDLELRKILVETAENICRNESPTKKCEVVFPGGLGYQFMNVQTGSGDWSNYDWPLELDPNDRNFTHHPECVHYEYKKSVKRELK